MEVHYVPKIVEVKVIQMIIKQLISSHNFLAQGMPCQLKHLLF